MTTTNTIGTTKTDENTHPFAGPEFVVFPHAKREKIRQALLGAHQVYHAVRVRIRSACGFERFDFVDN